MSAIAEDAECTRSATAPTLRASASWSIRKFDPTAAPAVSAASTISGVRLFAASVMPVSGVGQPAALWVRQHRRQPGHPAVRVGHRRGAALVSGGDDTGRRPRAGRWSP